MKQFLLYAAFIALSSLAPSCKGDFTCVCRGNGKADNYPIGKTSRSYAVNKCNSYQSMYNDSCIIAEDK